MSANEIVVNIAKGWDQARFEKAMKHWVDVTSKVRTKHHHDVDFLLNCNTAKLQFRVGKVPVTCGEKVVGGRHVMACSILNVNDNLISQGFAIHCPDDPWDPVIGEKTALQRAIPNVWSPRAKAAAWRAYLESRGIQPAGGDE